MAATNIHAPIIINAVNRYPTKYPTTNQMMRNTGAMAMIAAFVSLSMSFWSYCYLFFTYHHNCVYDFLKHKVVEVKFVVLNGFI